MKADRLIWACSGLASIFIVLHFAQRHPQGVILNDPAGASAPLKTGAVTMSHDPVFRSLLLHNGALHADFDAAIPFEHRADAARKAGKQFLSTCTNDFVLVYIKVNGAMSGAVLCSR